eukprot:8034272-Alexandrium_andersonii.AAC.1
MGQALPPHLRPAWWFIVRGQLGGAQEAQAELVTRWIDQHGPGLGFRAPSAAEQARALGLEAYFAALGLQGRALYDAEGNSFDYMAVAVRLAAAVEGLAAGRPPPRHDLPGLQELLGTYASARTWVRRGDWEVPDRPFPPD